MSLSRQTNNLDDGHEKTSGVTSSVVKVKIVFRRAAGGARGRHSIPRRSARAAAGAPLSSIPCVLAKDQATLRWTPTAKKILERHGIQTSSSFVKI